MSHQSVAHSTHTFERQLSAQKSRVFRALKDPADRAVWSAPFEGVTMEFDQVDVRPGGTDMCRCKMPDGEAFDVRSDYVDVVEDSRIIFLETISTPDGKMGASLATMELLDAPQGCVLVTTIQAAAVDGSGLEDGVAEGWANALDALTRMMNTPATV